MFWKKNAQSAYYDGAVNNLDRRLSVLWYLQGYTQSPRELGW